MDKSTQKKLSAEQEASLVQFKNGLVDRRTVDMVELLKLPAFLRYVGMIAKDCGVNYPVDGSISNDVIRREGRRSVGEMMMAQIRQVNIEAKFQIERLMEQDEIIRRRIINEGEKFKREDLLAKK